MLSVMMIPTILFLGLYSTQIFAWPTLFSESSAIDKSVKRSENDHPCPHMKEHSKRQAPGVTPPFNAAQQYVSNTGAHKFVAPGANDLRGPCPGLNAMANHGYLPHNGVGTIQDFITGTQDAFGMGVDLATVLAIYGAVFDGDLKSYSIGGPTPNLPLLGLLGSPQGLSGSHNKYEGDVSPTRGDLYQYGNDYLLQLRQFTDLYELGQQNGNSVDLDVLTKFRVTRFQESVSQNPYFFNAPFSGVVAQPAAWSFIYRFMANKSSEYPEGLLTGDVLKSFYSITGEPGNFVYTPGHETFPNNWYKRNPVDYYTVPYITLDANAMALSHLEFFSVGGNTGKANTFTGVDLTNLTGGVYTADNILKGNNLICFGFQASLIQAPDILSGLFSNVNAALDILRPAVDVAISGLGCPELNNINQNQFKDQFSQFPGYTQLKAKGTY